jgi:hypothetical protein
MQRYPCQDVYDEQDRNTPVRGGGFPLDNFEFKTWLHLKMLINAEMLLIDLSCHTPVDCVHCNIDILVFPI